MAIRKSSPRISVIIPAFNEQKFIGKCLDSVLKQKTTFSFEVIVVNNNSSDRTREIAVQRKVTVIDEKKPGSSAARNTGAKKAKAMILLFVDADCVLPRGHLRRVVDYFFTDPELEAVSGPYIYTDGGTWIKWLTGKLGYFYYYGLLIKFLFGFQALTGGNLAIKKQIFLEVGGFDEKINNQQVVLADDMELSIRLSEAGTKVLFDKNNRVFSSFRRVKKSPFKETLIRFGFMAKLLLPRLFRRQPI